MEHPAEAAELDAAYEPFPDLQVWSDGRYQPATWDVALRRLGEARAGADAPARRRAVETLMRAASIDTGAVEGLYEVDRGFTMSVARALTSSWTSSVERAKGTDVRRMVEDQRAAFDLALDLATGSEPLSEAAVREVHAVVCASQATYRVRTSVGPQDRPLPRGTYKTEPNHVLEPDGTWHPYAPVEDVGHEMHRLVAATRSAAYRDAHPVVQAAYLHHGLTTIHPFPDGNGRVARVLASVPLLRAVSLPLVLFSDQRAVYLDALAAADAGAAHTLVAWFEDRALDAIEEVIDALQPDLEAPDAVARLTEALTAPELRRQTSALRLLDLVEREVLERLHQMAPDSVHAQAHRPDALTAMERESVVRQRGEIAFILELQSEVVRARVVHHCRLQRGEESGPVVTLDVVHTDPGDLALPVASQLRIRTQQLSDGPDEHLRRRLRRWGEREAAALLEGLARVVEDESR